MTEIKLYNTKTRKKEVFQPLDWRDQSIPDADKKVRMYVCGPTVYDRAHIGNARPVIVFDVLYRLLREVYGAEHVTYARNFTDVDDKINTRAAELAENGDTRPKEEIIRELTDKTIRWYHEDMEALGSRRPDLEPRATEYIGEMIGMIEDLIARGFAYEAEGHVLFDVNSYEHYGSLSGRSVKDMIAGARVEVAPYKRDPMDFVLWKPSSDDLPGWESPWGRGRPGWHIECSAMSRALFGERFDIHGGGLDLQFPHHENEKAQSCSICGEDCFAQVWMHNEMLQVEGRKMSKSLGNFFSVRDLLDQGYPGEVIRFVYLSTHYRKPMDWTEKKAREAEAILDHWHRSTSELEPSREPVKISKSVLNVLSDDLNTYPALTAISALQGTPQELLDNARFLGFLSDDARRLWKERNSFAGYSFSLKQTPDRDEVIILENYRDVYMQAYEKAKENNDFSQVDPLRKIATDLGLKLKVSVKRLEIDATRKLSSDDFLTLKKATEALK